MQAKSIDGVETSNADRGTSYPGVYVEETSPGATPIDGVPTSNGPRRGGRLGSLPAAFALELRRRFRRLF